MDQLHLIPIAIVSLFMLTLIINGSMTDKVFQKKRFIGAFINLFAWIIVIVFYKRYIQGNDTYELIVLIVSFAVYFVFGIQLYASFRSSILRSSHYHLFIESIKNTRFNVFFVVDGKERIKEISESLLTELGVKYEDAIGKKANELFDRVIRFTKFNGADVNNKLVHEFYRGYRQNVKEGMEDKREIVFQNYDGQSIVLNVIEQPVYIMGRYKGRMAVGEKKSELTLLNAERQLQEKNTELEGIRQKFIATLEITEENLFYVDLDQRYIWGTNNYKDLLGLSGNNIGIDDFRNLIHQDDLVKYLKEMEALTKNNPYYSLSYRVLQKDHYIWVKEKGKRIFEDAEANVIMGYIKVIASTQFERTGIPELDNVLSETELVKDVQNFYTNHRTFEIVIIKVNNLPQINEQHGRAVGNMILGEYVRRIKQNFKTETSQIYRISGIDFVLTITDVRKMEMLKRIFEVEQAPLNLRMEYGGIDITVDARVGIAISSQDADNGKNLISCAKHALRFAADDNYMKNCCFYRDIR